MKHKISFISIVFLLTGLISTSVSAQTNSSATTLNIDSDNQEIDFKTGAIHFSGNVEMRHGAFLIKAEDIYAYRKNDVLEKAIAEGTPAAFEQAAGADRELVIASGLRIEFLDTATEQSIKLLGNAFLRQGAITATCNEIKIILEDGVVQHTDGSGGESQCQIISDGKAASTLTTSSSETNSETIPAPQPTESATQ